MVEYAETQIRLREATVLAPLENRDEILRREYMKGELAGIKLFLAIPEIQINQYESWKERSEQDERSGEGN